MRQPAIFCAILLGAGLLALTATHISHAQDLRRVRPATHCCKSPCAPSIAQAIVEFQNNANEVDRYALNDHSNTRTVVVDGKTGRVFVADPENLRVIDVEKGVVTIKSLTIQDERGGSIIRQR